MAATLTVANSTLALTTEALYPAAQRIQGYATDNAFNLEAVENGEYYMGIDGKLSAGFVHNAIPFVITLQADSPSLTLFENIYQHEVTNRTKLRQDVTITLPAVGKRYDLIEGYMTTYKAPEATRTLQPGVVNLTFSRVRVSPL